MSFVHDQDGKLYYMHNRTCGPTFLIENEEQEQKLITYDKWYKKIGFFWCVLYLSFNFFRNSIFDFIKFSDVLYFVIAYFFSNLIIIHFYGRNIKKVPFYNALQVYASTRNLEGLSVELFFTLFLLIFCGICTYLTPSLSFVILLFFVGCFIVQDIILIYLKLTKK